MSVGTMYALKPLIPIDLTMTMNDNCMYKMKNIHDVRTSDNDDHAPMFCNNVANISEQSPLPEVAALEARQEKILSQLAELKAQVLCLCDVLKLDNTPRTTPAAVKPHVPVHLDLIVNANPNSPCWCIPAIAVIWKDVDLCLRTYRHSDAQADPPQFTVNTKMQFWDTVNVDLIWKKVEDTETVVPGWLGYPLRGESNLLRYLARRLSTENDDEETNEQMLLSIDYILDMSHHLRYEDSPKEIQAALATMGKTLGGAGWMCGRNEPGIADVAAWSAIKGVSPNKMPIVLKSWYQRCENIFLK